MALKRSGAVNWDAITGQKLTRPTMKVPYQIPLEIDRPLSQDLDNFVVGNNQELIDTLTDKPDNFVGLWVHGPKGCGKSHLLRGACGVGESRAKCSYINCTQLPNRQKWQDSLTFAIDYAKDVFVDDVGAIRGDSVAEEVLLGLYQHVLHSGGRLVVAHTLPATAIEFDLPDLNSRMRSLMHFQILPLDDIAKAQLLQNRAQRRGYRLGQPVLDYWLARGPRDVGTLLIDLDVLDRATLARKQTVTIPLLKQVLGY